MVAAHGWTKDGEDKEAGEVTEDMVAMEVQEDNGVKMEGMVVTEAQMVAGEAKHGEVKVNGEQEVEAAAPGQLKDVVEVVVAVKWEEAVEVVVEDGVIRPAHTNVEPTAVIIY